MSLVRCHLQETAVCLTRNGWWMHVYVCMCVYDGTYIRHLRFVRDIMHPPEPNVLG